MSSHWDYVERVVAKHDKEKPFAPENGKPLKFEVGDIITFTNDAGITFRGFRVTGFYKPEQPCSLYATGKRYLLDWDCPWFPASESSLEFDSIFGKRFDEHFDAAVSGLQEYYGVLTNQSLVASLKESVSPNYRNTGNDQVDYEHLRDAVELWVGELSWDDVPDDERLQLIQAIGKGEKYLPTDEEIDNLFERWRESHEHRPKAGSRPKP